MTTAADSNPPGELYCSTCEKSFEIGERCPVDGTRLVRLTARIDPFLGRDLDGRFTVLEKLGQGAMGAVYRAQQHSVDREVAVKVVHGGLVSEPDVIKRFLREAKLASKLAHPNAVAVLDFGQTNDGLFYLVMELVTGRTLDQVLREEGRFTLERVVRIGTQILDALDGAHALSIVHRDLKPSNVMLLRHGRDHVKVLDFGLAKSISPDQTATTMTGTGAIVGTPAFMPPELATGSPCDGRADLYSLGCMLYQLASGRLPFESTSVHELVAMHGSDEPAPQLTGVPARFAMIVAKLLEKEPSRRYQTAADALHDLERSLSLSTPSLEVPLERDTLPAIVDEPVRPSASPDSLVATHVPSAAAPSAAAAHTHPGDTLRAPRRRWPIIIGLVVAIAATGIAIAIVAPGARDASGDAAPTPSPPAVSAEPLPPPHVEPVPAPEAEPATAPVATPPSVDANPPVATEPPADRATRPARPAAKTTPTKPSRPVTTPAASPAPPAPHVPADPTAPPF